MKQVVIIVALFAGFAANAATVKLSCHDGAGNVAQVSFAPGVLELSNKPPAEAIIRFSLNNKIQLRWKTGMFYSLLVDKQYLVQFKDNQPTNRVTGQWDFTFDEQAKPLTGQLSLQVDGEWSNYDMICSAI
ncbi:MAG: hypothetical protein ACXVA9_10640 [Bdellovibrionales bacterium]